MPFLSLSTVIANAAFCAPSTVASFTKPLIAVMLLPSAVNVTLPLFSESVISSSSTVNAFKVVSKVPLKSFTASTEELSAQKVTSLSEVLNSEPATVNVPAESVLIVTSAPGVMLEPLLIPLISVTLPSTNCTL